MATGRRSGAPRGRDCALQLDGVCNHDPATTVLCHSNYLADGKGMGLKAPDSAAAFGCAACYDLLDGRRPRPEGFSKPELEGAFYAGVRRTHHILRRLGPLPTTPTNKYLAQKNRSTIVVHLWPRPMCASLRRR